MRLGVTTVIHGGCSGVDKSCEAVAKRCGIHFSPFYADWDKYVRAAGPIRNQHMLDTCAPQVAIRFPGGKGTADMMKRCKKQVPERYVMVDELPKDVAPCGVKFVREPADESPKKGDASS